jgi:hypothetical protein
VGREVLVEERTIQELLPWFLLAALAGVRLFTAHTYLLFYTDP